MFLLLTQDRERCHGLEAPHGSRETGEHSGADGLNVVHLADSRFIRQAPLQAE